MRRSSRPILLVGIFLAVGAFILIVFLNAGPGPTATPTPAVAHIVVAAVDIPQGTTITDSMLSTKDVPLVEAPGDSLALKESVIGKVARQSVAAGAYIPNAAISGQPGTTAAVDIPKELKAGERAVALQIADPNNGVGFLVQSGDRVDVIVGLENIPIGFLFNLDPGNKTPADVPGGGVIGPAGGTGFQLIPADKINSTSAKLLIQNVRVVYAQAQPVAVAQGAQGTPPPGSQGLSPGPQLVILAVNAQQAEVVRYVLLQGPNAIFLALRSPVDAEASPDTTTGMVLRTLLDDYGVLPPRLVVTPDKGQ